MRKHSNAIGPPLKKNENYSSDDSNKESLDDLNNPFGLEQDGYN